MKNPNTKCCVCKKPLYRRPFDLKRSKNSYCGTHLYEHNAAREEGKIKYQKLRHESYIDRWKKGLETGRKGKGSVSDHIRRYLFERAGNKCEKCGWSKINKTTGKIPLEINHIDGNWKNNHENNLELLCPNCHSLTPNYRSLNTGKGRIR